MIQLFSLKNQSRLCNRELHRKLAETLEKQEEKQRSQRRKDARPQEIVAAALHEFSQRGFAATRLDDVATRAGVAKGTIYLYFNSKAELFKAVVQETVVPQFEQVGLALSEFEGPTEDLFRLFLKRMAHDFVETDIHHIIRLIQAEGRQFPELAEFYFKEVISRGMARIREILARGVERGEFRETGLEAFPQLVVAPAVMASMWKSTFETFSPLDLDKALDVQLDLILNGLKVSELEHTE